MTEMAEFAETEGQGDLKTERNREQSVRTPSKRSEVGGRTGRFAAKIYFVTRARSREEDAEPDNHTFILQRSPSDIHTAIRNGNFLG
jgi:hypothetical protein